MGYANRHFVNEVGNHIDIYVSVGDCGLARLEIVGPISSNENILTRMELIRIRDAITEALGESPAAAP